MPKFRKKPIVIDAIKLTYQNREALSSEFEMAVCPQNSRSEEAFQDFGLNGQGVVWISADRVAYALVKTLEGIMRGDEGDYLIRGVKGELYFCKPDIFEMTYEKAD